MRKLFVKKMLIHNLTDSSEFKALSYDEQVSEMSALLTELESVGKVRNISFDSEQGLFSFTYGKGEIDGALGGVLMKPLGGDIEVNGIELQEKINLNVNGKDLVIVLEDNSSAKAFVEKLKNGKVVVNAHDYGSFEKVGSLGFSLPTNDKNITTKPGDLILYQGNQITLYYDTNTWSFTKLGHVENVTSSELRSILGSSDVVFTFSLIEE